MFFNLAWKFRIMSPSSSDKREDSVSSAYRLAFENFRQVSKSLNYNMKSNCPRQDPCGIPHACGRERDLWPFDDQYCWRLLRFFLNHSTSIPSIPYTFSSLISISWSTVSNAFLRSRNSAKLALFLSILSYQLSETLIREVMVECSLRYANWLIVNFLVERRKSDNWSCTTFSNNFEKPRRPKWVYNYFPQLGVYT